MWRMENGQRYRRSEAKKIDERKEEEEEEEGKERRNIDSGEISRLALSKSLAVKGVCTRVCPSMRSIDEIPPCFHRS